MIDGEYRLTEPNAVMKYIESLKVSLFVNKIEESMIEENSAFAKLLCQGQIFSAINSVTQQQLFYFFWSYGFWVLFFWQLATLKAFPLNKN